MTLRNLSRQPQQSYIYAVAKYPVVARRYMPLRGPLIPSPIHPQLIDRLNPVGQTPRRIILLQVSPRPGIGTQQFAI